MTLAYLGQKGDLWEAMARDAFVGALGDTNLRSKILESDPPTLDETLKLACRFESIAGWSAAADDNSDDQGRRRDRLARGAGVGDDRGTTDMARRFEQLEAALRHMGAPRRARASCGCRPLA